MPGILAGKMLDTLTGKVPDGLPGNVLHIFAGQVPNTLSGHVADTLAGKAPDIFTGNVPARTGLQLLGRLSRGSGQTRADHPFSMIFGGNVTTWTGL